MAYIFIIITIILIYLVRLWYFYAFFSFDLKFLIINEFNLIYKDIIIEIIFE